MDWFHLRICPYLIEGVEFILQAHDEFHSLQADLQLTQRGRSHMYRPFPRYRDLTDGKYFHVKINVI